MSRFDARDSTFEQLRVIRCPTDDQSLAPTRVSSSQSVRQVPPLSSFASTMRGPRKCELWTLRHGCANRGISAPSSLDPRSPVRSSPTREFQYLHNFPALVKSILSLGNSEVGCVRCFLIVVYVTVWAFDSPFGASYDPPPASGNATPTRRSNELRGFSSATCGFPRASGAAIGLRGSVSVVRSQWSGRSGPVGKRRRSGELAGRSDAGRRESGRRISGHLELGEGRFRGVDPSRREERSTDPGSADEPVSSDEGPGQRSRSLSRNTGGVGPRRGDRDGPARSRPQISAAR